MAEQGISKQKIFAELAKSSHGKLGEYVTIGKQAIEQESEFFQHLIAWNAIHGQIRDSKVALPVLGLAYEKDTELLDNSLAHLADLNPRELLKAFMFLRELRPKGRMMTMDRLVRDYLHDLESEKGWDHVAVQHGKVLRSLYAYARVKPTKDRVRIVLFGGVKKGEKSPLPKGSIFEAVANLKKMSATEAAAVIVKFKIPFLIAAGALEEKAKEPDLVLALLDRMSSSELITNMKMLEKLGVKTNPAIRGAFEKAMEKAATSKKNTLKTTQAVDAVEDEGLKEKLRAVQKKQIAAAGGPEGDWAVLIDKSGSMAQAIETGRNIAAQLAQFVKGKVYMVFFDTSPMTVEVTNLSLDQIQKATKHIPASGGTSIGCALNRLLHEKIMVDGIAIVSDGGEHNAPLFADVYPKYTKLTDKDVPVYFYQLSGDPDYFSTSMNAAKIEMQTFDLRGSAVDYYSLPNLVKSMSGNPYNLLDEIMATPLVSLTDVLKNSTELVGA